MMPECLLQKRFQYTGAITIHLAYQHLPTLLIDPVHEGNLRLQPYSQHTNEGGIRYLGSNTQFNAACFYNRGKRY
jgi:hypothetical protein